MDKYNPTCSNISHTVDGEFEQNPSWSRDVTVGHHVIKLYAYNMKKRKREQIFDTAPDSRIIFGLIYNGFCLSAENGLSAENLLQNCGDLRNNSLLRKTFYS